MKFTIEKPNTEQPLRAYLEQDSDGDVILKVTNGSITADIGFLSAEAKCFRVFDYSTNGVSLALLGFSMDDNKVSS